MRNKALRGLFAASVALVPLAACSSAQDQGLSAADAESLVDLFVADARGSTTAASGTLSAQSGGGADSGGSLHVLTNCTPTRLSPPTACDGGGNIYTTVDQSCTDPSGCCGNLQNRCAADHVGINGIGKFYYNGCRSNDRVTVDGSLNWTDVLNVTVPCDGAATGSLKITWNGIPSVRVDGKEVCNGTVFVTATIQIGTTISGSISGTICGVPVSRALSFGCVVDCGGSRCCSAGTYCSKCGGGCFSNAYPNECCDGSGKACPSGLRCLTGGTCGP